MVNRGQGSHMAMNKRGIFFTVLVILILTMFVISFAFYSQIQERKTTQKRIETMNSFLFSIEKDLPRQVYVSGFRTIFLIEGQIVESGSYVSSLDSIFQESFFNGTISGVPQPLMIGATFPEIQAKMQDKAAKINANITLSNPVLTVTQDDPWNVKFILTTDFLMEDLSGLVFWNKTETTVSYVPVENFDDPIYLVNTGGIFSNKISKALDVSDFTGMDSNYTKYMNNSDAPSFLGKLQGLETPDENGIESLVNLEKLSNLGINAKEGVTIVDHSYFSLNPLPGCHVQGKEGWFLLDPGHLAAYGLSCG